MNNRFFFLTILLISGFFQQVKAADLRSDTVDILHIGIHLDITDISGKSIAGYSTLTCRSLQNGMATLNLDLLKLTIDSIKMGSSNLSYSYNDTLIQIQLGAVKNVGDTFDVSVYYHGQPQKDLSGWGGFYFNSGHAFNLGVGFQADPHNYGRIWFPCFDNFVERSTFTFEIITSNGRKAYCNGEFISENVLNADTVMTTWEMRESIPTYLACVAVGPYTEVKWNYTGIQSTIPVVLAVKSSDSTKLKGSFIHLDDAMDAFEDAYGPYLFNKIGYSVVPFGSGAMEHASNIAYPSNAVNGNTGSELLMAHELSHHWWGDLITCDDQGDMWINEGWASFSEQLFLEHVYGKERYLEEMRSNHLNVIQYAHYREGKYWPVSGVPHEYTYGMHVYDKGASVAHNLRAYMGDTKFFAAIKTFMDDYKFSDVSSALMRDEFEKYSGLDLSDFFDDWVFGPGYTHLSIDSFTVTPTPGLTSVEIFVHQKKRGTDHFFNNVPVTVTFIDDQFNVSEETIIVSGEYSSFQFQLPMQPVSISLNADDKLAMAVTADQTFVSTTSLLNFNNGKMKIDVEEVSDSVFLRVEHHWAHADAIKNPTVSHRISDYRYWKVDGVFPSTFKASATISFDGRSITSGGGGNLDNDLLKNGSDSLILLYRKDASRDWWEYKYYSKVNFGGLNFGTMELDSLLPGEYVLANGYSAIGINEENAVKANVTLSPNPASNELNIIEQSGDSSLKDVYLFSMEGKLLKKISMTNALTLDISKLTNGSYLIYILKDNEEIYSGKFLVSK